MTHPRHITIDVEAGAAMLLYYAADERRVVRTERFTPDISADFDSESSILGIELLSLDDDVIGHAREIAHRHGLAFPRDLGGAFVAA